MKKVYYLVFLFLIIGGSMKIHAQKNSIRFFVLKFEEKQPPSNADTVYVYNGDESLVVWKHDTIFKRNSFDVNQPFIQCLDSLGWYKNLFLIDTWEGNSCPSVYMLIEFESRNKFYKSNEFGNCGWQYITEIHKAKNILEFKFLENKEPEYMNRPAASFYYSHFTHAIGEK